MKYLGLFFAFTLILLSCTKEEEKENTPEYLNIVYTPTANDTLINTGTFSNFGNYSVSGSIKVYKNDNYKLIRFEDFMCANGPNLKVYLAKNQEGGDFINLGDLKATSGNFNYVFSFNTNTAEYRYVQIKDETLDKQFGVGELQ